MGIRKRGDKFFVDKSHKGERRTATCATMEEARAMEAQLHAELLAGVQRTQCWTLGEACAATMAARWAGRPSETKNHQKVQALLSHFGADRLLDGIGLEQVDGFVAARRAHRNSNATINRYLACLSTVFNHAKRRDRCSKVPHFERGREGGSRLRWLLASEERYLLEAMRECGYAEAADFTVFLVETGLRPFKEALPLGRSTLYRGGKLHVGETKNGTPRVVPATARCREVLARRSSWTLTEGAYRHVFTRAATMAGLDRDVIPYTLRHTCATRLYERTRDILLVKEWLGHKDIKVTLRYAKLTPGAWDDAVRAMDEARGWSEELLKSGGAHDVGGLAA